MQIAFIEKQVQQVVDRKQVSRRSAFVRLIVGNVLLAGVFGVVAALDLFDGLALGRRGSSLSLTVVFWVLAAATALLAMLTAISMTSD